MTDDIETIAANSYANFHAKGLHYLCLRRSPERTEKVYFFEGEVIAAPEVINPHDHRYDFETTCLAGEVENHTYRQVWPTSHHAEPFNCFKYMTPLNGGSGFTWYREESLLRTQTRAFGPGGHYWSAAESIHTISVKAGTVLRLVQCEDVKPLSAPTLTWCRGGREPPSLSGLYDRMTVDRAKELLRQYQSILERGV